MIRYGHRGRSPWDENNYLYRVELCSVRYEEVDNIYEYTSTLDEIIEIDKMLNEGLNGVWNKSMEDVLKPMHSTYELSHLVAILLVLVGG